MRSGFRLDMIADADTFISASGDPIKVLYSAVLEDGDIKLVESGKLNLQESINAWADFTDMSYIIARLTAGDDSVLNVKQPLYGDFSGMPHDHAALLNTVMDARTYFDHLSDDVRARFGDNFLTWIGSAGSRDWSDKMTGKLVDPAAAAASQVDQPAHEEVTKHEPQY